MAFLQGIQHRILKCTRSNAKTQQYRSSLGPKKVDICEIQESKTDSVDKNKYSPSDRIFQDRKVNKQLGLGFLVKKSLTVTSTNLVNDRLSTLTVTKKDKFKSKSAPMGVKIFRSKKKQCDLSLMFMPPTWEWNPPKKAP